MDVYAQEGEDQGRRGTSWERTHPRFVRFRPLSSRRYFRLLLALAGLVSIPVPDQPPPRKPEAAVSHMRSPRNSTLASALGQVGTFPLFLLVTHTHTTTPAHRPTARASELQLRASFLVDLLVQLWGVISLPFCLLGAGPPKRTRVLTSPMGGAPSAGSWASGSVSAHRALAPPLRGRLVPSVSRGPLAPGESLFLALLGSNPGGKGGGKAPSPNPHEAPGNVAGFSLRESWHRGFSF